MDGIRTGLSKEITSGLSFLSFVYPGKKWSLALYRHQLADFLVRTEINGLFGIPPEGGIEAAYKRQLAESEDPAALRAELAARIETARGPLGPLSKFQMEEMIDPRDTRPLICEWAETAARVAASPDRFTRGAPQFRP